MKVEGHADRLFLDFPVLAPNYLAGEEIFDPSRHTVAVRTRETDHSGPLARRCGIKLYGVSDADGSRLDP